MLDGGRDIDVEAVCQNIDDADVVSLYFPMLRRTLLADLRTNASDGPLVRVVPMVNSSSERLESLRSLRPGFDRPSSITLVPWRRSVRSLRTDGVWDRLVARLEGWPAACADAQRCVQELRSLEALEQRQAIVGQHYRTLWGRAGVGDQGLV